MEDEEWVRQNNWCGGGARGWRTALAERAPPVDRLRGLRLVVRIAEDNFIEIRSLIFLIDLI